MTTLTKDQMQILFTDVQTGIDKHITADITLDGVPYTKASLKATFAKQLEAILAPELAYERFRDSVEAANRAQAEGLALFDALRSAVLGQYGKGAKTVLADFGMKAPKPTGPKTVAAKAQGIARSAATRAMRHTMGSRQEQLVKGTVEVPNPALPETAAPAAEPTATPAVKERVAAPSTEVKPQS